MVGNPLLADFIPVQVLGKLPARLEPDGSLRVQVQPGRWVLRVLARHPGELGELAMPAQADPWPARETWVYRASLQDRVAEVGGATQIDPRQVRLPADFANLPTYQLAAGERLTFTVVRRGDPVPEPDRLSLRRELWLDFDGRGYTLRDHLHGRMTSDWRLAVAAPLTLGRVTIDGRPQFITRLADDPRSGVEVRRGELDLVAESRLEGAVTVLPATGWGRDFQAVETRLHLPPGWRLLAVGGVDNVPDSWLQRWTLYDLFLVLIVTLAVARLWRWYWAPVALLTLALTWHEPLAPQMIWLYLLATIALLRVVPARGRAYQLVRGARLLGLLALLVSALPFLVQQAREAIYPQLELPWVAPQAVGAAPPAAPLTEPVRSAAKRAIAESAEVLSLDAQREPATLPTPARALDQLDPKALLQTGPGLPRWEWRTASLDWNGPVAAGQQIHLYLLGPSAQRVYKWLSIALVLLLAWRFVAARRAANGRWRVNVLLAGLLAGWGGAGSAADFPPPALLEQLQQRLLERRFEPPLADLPALQLRVDADRYEADLTVHALEPTAIPLPLDTRQVTPVRVLVDGAPQPGLFRTQPNQLWLLVPAGQHQVSITALLPPADQLQIPLPLRPRRVQLALSGWSAEGLDANGVPDGQLSLTRLGEGAASAAADLVPAVLPPFLRVERLLRLGIDWEVETRVRRASPLGVPLSVQVPLLPGESVTTEALRVKDGMLTLNLAANQAEAGWRSRLDPVASLTLTAPDTTQWVETWRADIGPIWHVEVSGIPPVHHQDGANNWLPAWHPWPGEQITLRVQRPGGVPGNTVTIDASELRVAPGQRATDATLSFALSASQGGRHDLQLPPGAVLQAVQIDGRTQPIRQEGRRVSLPVVPGEQGFEIAWREDAGTTGIWRTPELDLGTPSVNATLTVTVPQDRWTLWLRGPNLGPAILFWGVLAVVVLIAVALTLASASYLPLGLVSWLLLGLGLTQASVLSLLLVAGWFFLLHYRGKLDAQTPRWRFNLVQVGVVLLTLATAAVLFQAVQQGLLGRPEMQIQGYGSSAYQLHWYQDRVAGLYPRADIISVPLWVYRGLMLAWALWLAFSLLGWVRWGWQAFARGGLWRAIAWPRLPARTAPDRRGTPGGGDACGTARRRHRNLHLRARSRQTVRALHGLAGPTGTERAGGPHPDFRQRLRHEQLLCPRGGRQPGRTWCARGRDRHDAAGRLGRPRVLRSRNLAPHPAPTQALRHPHGNRVRPGRDPPAHRAALARQRPAGPAQPRRPGLCRVRGPPQQRPRGHSRRRRGGHLPHH